MKVQMERDGEHKLGTVGFLGRCVQKRSWQMLLPSTAAGNGPANPARRQMCGRGGGAVGATRTSLQGCKESMDRPYRRMQECIHRDPHLQVVEKRRGPEMQWQRFENCAKNSSVVNTLRRDQEPSTRRQVVKVGTMKFGRWISERKSCKNCCVKLRGSQMYRKVRNSSSRNSGSKNCKMLSKGGMISCRNIRKNS